MDKLGGALRNARSELRTSAAFPGPRDRYLRQAAEGWVRFKQPRATPSPRLRQAKLDPKRPWTLDAHARRDSLSLSAGGRAVASATARVPRSEWTLRRVPSPLTNVPEEMDALAELDDRAADALRRLFEHCDAAAAYTGGDDFDGLDANIDGTYCAGWSRVDDGQGVAERANLRRGPDAATLATYAHERETHERETRETVSERGERGERGRGGGGSIPAESAARRSLRNALRVLGASEASRRAVDGWLGLLTARVRRVRRVRAGNVVDVDDALAASVPALYTGKDVREVAFRDVGGALVRLGGDGEMYGESE